MFFQLHTAIFLASAIVNILEPGNNSKIREFIIKWLGIDRTNDLTLKKIKESITKEKIKLFLDMYEFWHKALKCLKEV